MEQRGLKLICTFQKGTRYCGCQWGELSKNHRRDKRRGLVLRLFYFSFMIPPKCVSKQHVTLKNHRLEYDQC